MGRRYFPLDSTCLFLQRPSSKKTLAEILRGRQSHKQGPNNKDHIVNRAIPLGRETDPWAHAVPFSLLILLPSTNLATRNVPMVMASGSTGSPSPSAGYHATSDQFQISGCVYFKPIPRQATNNLFSLSWGSQEPGDSCRSLS